MTLDVQCSWGAVKGQPSQPSSYQQVLPSRHSFSPIPLQHLSQMHFQRQFSCTNPYLKAQPISRITPTPRISMLSKQALPVPTNPSLHHPIDAKLSAHPDSIRLRIAQHRPKTHIPIQDSTEGFQLPNVSGRCQPKDQKLIFKKSKQQKIKLVARPLSQSVDSLGHEVRNKSCADFRFVFTNHNGIPPTRTSYSEFFLATQDLQADWVGIAETHLDTTKAHGRESFKSALRATRAFTFRTVCSHRAI